MSKAKLEQLFDSYISVALDFESIYAEWKKARKNDIPAKFSGVLSDFEYSHSRIIFWGASLPGGKPQPEIDLSPLHETLKGHLRDTREVLNVFNVIAPGEAWCADTDQSLKRYELLLDQIERDFSSYFDQILCNFPQIEKESRFARKYLGSGELPDLPDYPTAFFAGAHGLAQQTVTHHIRKLRKKYGEELFGKEDGKGRNRLLRPAAKILTRHLYQVEREKKKT